MKSLKTSQRASPKISLILLDWSVRESFHLLHYLSKQTLNRDLFEVIVVEYYSRVSPALQHFEDEVDTWVLLEMPTDCYYHKHLMYNVGIVQAKGEIVIICDSDAMAKPTFLQAVIDHFESQPNSILHLDQFRNNRRDMYPFNYPDFDEVIGKGCINYRDGKTVGLASTKDPIHERNYGACFCAKREDLIKIGGADEHVDFVGHICGPYDLTFRLINMGHKEVWHQSEFLYHTWHPGQAGVDNYLGPHDGRHVSTTSLDMLISGFVLPHVMNPAIKALREGKLSVNALIHPEVFKFTSVKFLRSNALLEYAQQTYSFILCQGKIFKKVGESSYEAQSLLRKYHPQQFSSELITVAGGTNKFDNNGYFERLIACAVYYNSIKKWNVLKFEKLFLNFKILANSAVQVESPMQKKSSIFKPKRKGIFLKFRQLYERIPFEKFDQLKLETRFLTKYLLGMIENAKLAKSCWSVKDSQLWVSDYSDLVVLKILMLLRVIPKMKIRTIASWEQLSDYLKGYASSDAGKVFFTSELYIKFAGFLSAELDKPWIVL